MKTSELVAKAKKATGTKTAYALAKVTGISEDSLKNYEVDKVGKNGITNHTARLLAEAAGLNPLEVIAELEIERAKTEQERSAWGKALASMKGMADPFLLAVLSGALSWSLGGCFRGASGLMAIIFVM